MSTKSTRFWVSLDGKTQGPHGPSVLVGLPGFGAETLVAVAGAQPGAWQKAREIPEVAEALAKREAASDDATVGDPKPPPPPAPNPPEPSGPLRQFLISSGAAHVPDAEVPTRDELERKIRDLGAMGWGRYAFIFRDKATGHVWRLEWNHAPGGAALRARMLARNPYMELLDILVLEVIEIERTGASDAGNSRKSGTRYCARCTEPTTPHSRMQSYEYSDWVPKRQRNMYTGNEWQVEQMETRTGQEIVTVCTKCGGKYSFIKAASVEEYAQSLDVLMGIVFVAGGLVSCAYDLSGAFIAIFYTPIAALVYIIGRVCTFKGFEKTGGDPSIKRFGAVLALAVVSVILPPYIAQLSRDGGATHANPAKAASRAVPERTVPKKNTHLVSRNSKGRNSRRKDAVRRPNDLPAGDLAVLDDLLDDFQARPTASRKQSSTRERPEAEIRRLLTEKNRVADAGDIAALKETEARYRKAVTAYIAAHGREEWERLRRSLAQETAEMPRSNESEARSGSEPADRRGKRKKSFWRRAKERIKYELTPID